MPRSSLKPGRAARRRQRDSTALALAAGGVLALLLLAAALLKLEAPGAISGGSARIGGPFTLVADDGSIVTDRSFPGKYKLVYFGYSACRDVCPATLSTLAAAMARLGGKADAIQPLFITLDPARDTPSVLHRYVENFGVRLLGLTGDPAELQKVAGEYRVTSETRAEKGGVAIDHSSVIYLMAPDGEFVAPIRASASEMVMTREIARRLD